MNNNAAKNATTGVLFAKELDVRPLMAEELDEQTWEEQTWEEYEAEEWRRTCELTYEDIVRIFGKAVANGSASQ